MPGSQVNDDSINTVEEFKTIEEVTEKLKKSVDLVEKNNSTLINYWKFAPGEGATHWDEFYKLGIIAIGWDEVNKSLNELTSEELLDKLQDTGSGSTNTLWNMENFRDAGIGDIIIANKGKKKALGIGVITGEYYFDVKKSSFRHCRKVNWLVNKRCI